MLQLTCVISFHIMFYNNSDWLFHLSFRHMVNFDACILLSLGWGVEKQLKDFNEDTLQDTL